MANSVTISYPFLLANLFSSSFVNKILEDKHQPYITGILQQTNFLIKDNQSIKSVLSKVFDYLNESYRCEYVYKTAILNEVLLKRHDFLNSVYLTEFRAFNAKADILILNGTSSVYEIKSDVDNLERLYSQVSAYQKIFDKVFVVCNRKNVLRIKTIVPGSIGVIVLNPDLTIETIKEARSNISKLDKSSMFDSLRKPEYLSIINKAFGFVPDLPGTQIHSYCKKLFCTLSNKKAHNYFVDVLKTRQFNESQIRLIKKSSLGLKCLFTDRFYSEKECQVIDFSISQRLS